MIPFNVKVGGQKVSISFESLVWFFIVTAGATAVGSLIYDKWISPYLADFPSLPTNLFGSNQPALPPASGSVVSEQTPASSSLSGVRRSRGAA